MTSEEVLKDIQTFLDEEDNENIKDEDVNLDELYFCSVLSIHSVTLLVDFCIH